MSTIFAIAVVCLVVYAWRLADKSKSHNAEEQLPPVKATVKRDLERLLPTWHRAIRDNEWAIQRCKYNVDIQTIVLKGLDSDSNKAEFDYVSKSKLRFENMLTDYQHELDVLLGDTEMVEFNKMKSEIYKREKLAEKQLKRGKK